MFKKDALTEFFDEVRQKCTFQYWFFGHYHSNMVIEKRYAMLYEQIIRLNQNHPLNGWFEQAL